MSSTEKKLSQNDRAPLLHTSTGEYALQEYLLRQSGRSWSIFHTSTMLTYADEAHFFDQMMDRLPYGVALWPAAIALAHEVASRAQEIQGTQILELGAGTGLPGIVAASLGGRVLQTDRHGLALTVCKRNGERNNVQTVAYQLADWTNWDNTTRYDWILGSDILYNEPMHPYLRRIFESNLSSVGRVLVADPLRDVSFHLLEQLETDGWAISMSKWNVGEDNAPRTIGVFELTPPR